VTIPAIILAGGRSSRMGRPKALLPIDQNQTFLSRIVRVLATAGVDEVVVVVGDVRPDDIYLTLKGAEKMPRVVVNPDPGRGQLSSLLVGLETLEQVGVDAVLVTLVDVPLVTVETVRKLLETYKSTRAPIVRPTRRNNTEHGHPVIFDRGLFTELRQASISEGVKPVVRAYERAVVNVPIDDDGAFVDIDTPSDYERLVGRSFPRANQ
jgi:molybdenum cofactor cytidylyltransferase